MKNKQTLYEEVVKKISQLIESKSLRPGEKVPSIRDLKSTLKMSKSTILQAYSILESRGLIEAKPKSGFFVRIRNTSKKETIQLKPLSSRPIKLEISDFIQDVLSSPQKSDVISFGTALIDATLMPTKELNSLLASSAKKLGAKTLSYNAPPGSLNLRRQLALRSLQWGLNLSADDFITTTGCIEAITLALQAVAKPGDTIAIECATFFGILRIIESLGMKAIVIPTNSKDGMDLEALAKAADTHKVAACITVTNFQNPTGSLMSIENKKKLVKILNSRNIPLIENDIYGDIHFDSQRPTLAKSFDEKDLVIVCSSFSKSVAPGFRVGWIVPGQFYSRVKYLKASMIGESVAVTEEAMAEFMRRGMYTRHLKKVRRAVKDQMSKTRRAVFKAFPPETIVSNPQGGLVLWIQLPKNVNALELQQKALKKDISIAPGPIFSATKQCENNIRLNCGLLFDKERESAIQKLGDLIRQEQF